jgi:hypothetical protein
MPKRKQKRAIRAIPNELKERAKCLKAVCDGLAGAIVQGLPFIRKYKASPDNPRYSHLGSFYLEYHLQGTSIPKIELRFLEEDPKDIRFRKAFKDCLLVFIEGEGSKHEFRVSDPEVVEKARECIRKGIKRLLEFKEDDLIKRKTDIVKQLTKTKVALIKVMNTYKKIGEDDA